MARVRASFLGTGSSDFFEVTVRTVGQSAVAYSGGCGVVPDSLDRFTEVFEGGTIEGNLCWNIVASDAPSLVMFADLLFVFDESERRWFSLRP